MAALVLVLPGGAFLTPPASNEHSTDVCCGSARGGRRGGQNRKAQGKEGKKGTGDRCSLPISVLSGLMAAHVTHQSARTHAHRRRGHRDETAIVSLLSPPISPTPSVLGFRCLFVAACRKTISHLVFVLPVRYPSCGRQTPVFDCDPPDLFIGGSGVLERGFCQN